MATDFSDLGLDPDDIRIDLQALGIDDLAYTDDELKSLSLAANIILLQAISNKSTSVEEDLSAYQIEVDITSGMQETLNDLRDYISPADADVEDVYDFAASSQQYMDISDASLVTIDYTYDGTTYETLQDLFDALDDDDHELLDAYVTSLQDLDDFHELYFYDVDTGLSSTAFRFDDSIDQTYLDGFAEGDYYLNLRLASNYPFTCTVDDVKRQVIADALQGAGYIEDDVYTELQAFADVSLNSGVAAEYLEMVQLYFGALTIDYDSSAGTLTLDMSGCAGLRQMGIEMGEYFQEPDSDQTVLSIYPFGDSTDDRLNRVLYKKVYDDYWDDDKGDDITKGDDPVISNDDIDTLLQSAATAIESQSTDAEVALLTVNSGISEWGELNDVWDLIHEYVHDSLNKASNNTV
jgi:hypothetical protein